MKNVLFVDDERLVLDGLRRTLRERRDDWNMTFVESGRAALEELSSSNYDVIVSDMRMPGMDGRTLLARVQNQYPGVVRIVLSGYSELERVLRAVPIAHHFLSKPCDAQVIQNVISRACALQGLLQQDVLRELLESAGPLPALPEVYHAVMIAMQDPDAAIRDVVRIVERDPALTAKILGVVNSELFGIHRTISDLEDATGFLGLNMLRNLTLSMEVLRAFESSGAPDGSSVEDEHSMLCAQIARHLPQDKTAAENAFMAAMLHDVGKLVIETKLPEAHGRLVAAREASPLTDHSHEEQLLGTSHAEIGAYLLGLWGLPYPIVEAVANHHRPARVEHTSLDALGAVHVADALAREVLAPEDIGEERLDLEYLEALGVLDQLPRWRELAHEEACALGSAG